MSMSVYLHAFRDMDLDAIFTKMMKIKEYCEEQGVGYPPEVIKFFGDNIRTPNDFIIRDMAIVDLKGAEKSGYDESCNGQFIEVELSKIPKEVKRLRFVVSF